ncbi:serine hydrolase domain-containing protein [Actinacidiphila paucisporea]|uniref:D-alanyl-D-alanine carboxypeptidase n=1 Tax=Actinacidiphila paucisporea TaxID=310782 RepID=A0A1M7CG02_9ACTN|nr:serine hydrolase domain-containing protein [Actinacidiphila paucisporea]SHL66120.1 D-alanyl-D-alanine carboxypeptidase [Actinacidiphila paucisporea]
MTVNGGWGSGADGGEELLPATRRALLHRVAVGQRDGRTPSLVGAVVRDGAMVWCGSRSMIEGHAPDADTQYRIGSITKSLVAVLVMRLRDEGLLELTDPLSRHLPETAVEAGAGGLDAAGLSAAGRLTVGQLLSHTSGLASETPGPWWERTPGSLRPELADVLGTEPIKHPAGRRYHYSNPGFALLGALVEQVRGVPWAEALQAEVLDPLGMARTTLLPQAPAAGGFAVHPWADVMRPETVQETGRMAPAGQLWSTAGDLARWAAFLMAGREGVLSTATLEEMRQPAVPPEAADMDGGYGLGIQLSRRGGRLLAGHTGSMPGFLATVWVSVEDGVGAVALANATSGPQIGTIATDLLAITLDAEPSLPAAWRPADALAPDLLELAGPWYWGTQGFALRIDADGGPSLAPLTGQGRATRFHVEHDGTWTGREGYYAGETLRVMRTADGSVSHLDLGSFVFTREPYDPSAPLPGGFPGWH